MGEAFQCDRCGSFHPLEPDTTLGLGGGVPRQRESPAIPKETYHETTVPYTIAVDLCRACRNDLERWYSEGGGDPSDVAREVSDGD